MQFIFLLVTNFVLLQAIFSDDSDDEVEDFNINRVENQDKKAEVANTALSRLIAGDFLESLGKELGLEVPPDTPYLAQKSRNAAPQKETSIADVRTDIPNVENIGDTLNRGLPHAHDIAHEAGSPKNDTIYGNMLESGSSKTKGTSMSNNTSSDFNREKEKEDRKTRAALTRHQDHRSSSSSEEEKSRKRTRHHRSGRHNAGSDSSSDDDRDRYSSKSKRRKEGSSRKHHKHRRRDSPSRTSHYSSRDKDHADGKREKKRRE